MNTQIAQAKTKGLYLGISGINTNIEYYSSVDDPIMETTSQLDTQTKNSFGVDLKYAFNFNNFFIAPKVFYDYNNVVQDYRFKTIKTGRIANFDINYNLKHSHGFGFDIGYDFNNKFSLYCISQYKINSSSLSYFAASTDLYSNARLDNFKKEKYHYESLVYGIGLKYKLINNVDLFLSHEPSININSTNNTSKGYSITRLGLSLKI